MGGFKLTIRHGSKVTRESHETLPEAVAALRAHAERIRAEGNLPEISAIRTYEPGQRVHARLEISTGRMLRSRDAGIDVMGNGALVPFAGGVRRRELSAGGRGTAFDAVEEALRDNPTR